MMSEMFLRSARLRVVIQMLLSITLAALFAFPTALGGAPVPSATGEAVPASLDCAEPALHLTTELGAIAIDLDAEAAPEAVAAIVRLARGPLYDPALTTAAGGEIGYYDGLELDFVNPTIEVATATRTPRDLFLVETAIDATALGLDDDRIADAATAMDVLQRELIPQHTRHKKRGRLHPRLAEWLEIWFATYDPSFLVGVSRREINEALGYVYRSGLPSRPPVRGSVALRPASPTQATPALSILLTDLPERTGRWMVVGEVSAGLDVAEAISRRPLLADRAQRLLRPIDPVIIQSAMVACAPAAGPDPPPGGTEP
jgi:cyclophilin family peptidyl-prolyl cis-trans isomerase